MPAASRRAHIHDTEYLCLLGSKAKKAKHIQQKVAKGSAVLNMSMSINCLRRLKVEMEVVSQASNKASRVCGEGKKELSIKNGDPPTCLACLSFCMHERNSNVSTNQNPPGKPKNSRDTEACLGEEACPPESPAASLRERRRQMGREAVQCSGGGREGGGSSLIESAEKRRRRQAGMGALSQA